MSFDYLADQSTIAERLTRAATERFGAQRLPALEPQLTNAARDLWNIAQEPLDRLDEIPDTFGGPRPPRTRRTKKTRHE